MSFIHRASNSHRRRLAGGAYDDLVMGTGPIAYWPQSEQTGVVATCLTNPAMNGTYTGVTLANDLTGPFGTPAPFYDGANDYCDVHSAALAAAHNGVEGTVAIWAKVNSIANWTDATSRHLINSLADADNGWFMAKSSTHERIVFRYEAGAVSETVYADDLTHTLFFHVAQTWSKAAEKLLVYVNGVNITESLSLGVWAGALTVAIAGASSAAPATPWHGWLGPYGIWDRALPPSTIEILSLQ
jgi:hypothetical protein